MSLFELPVSRGARVARIAIVLALDLVLVGAGLAMILSYLGARDRAATPAATAVDAGVGHARVEDTTPTPLAGAGIPARPVDGEAEPGPSPSTPSPSTPGPSPTRPSPTRPSPSTPSPSPSTPSPSPSAPSPSPSPSTPSPSPSTPSPSPSPSPSPADPIPDSPADPAAPVDPYEDPPSGEPTAEEMQIFTGRISLVFKAHRAQMERCYEQAAKLSQTDDPLSGRVDVRFKVDQEGKARDVRAVENNTGSQQLAQCVTALVSSWDFPLAPGSQPVDLMWPFRFSPP